MSDDKIKKLNNKQRMFVLEYLIDLNATQAAIRAGYSEDTAGEMGYENLKKPQIALAIQEAMDERSKRLGTDSDYVLTTIVQTIERCKQASPVRYKNGDMVFTETPDGDTVPAYSFDSGAVLKGSELLGKHLKMFTDKTEITGKDGGPVQYSGISDLELDARVAALKREILEADD